MAKIWIVTFLQPALKEVKILGAFADVSGAKKVLESCGVSFQREEDWKAFLNFGSTITSNGELINIFKTTVLK